MTMKSVLEYAQGQEWGRKVSTEQAEAGWRAEVVQVLVKQLDGAYTPTHSSLTLLN
jgi:hypothetical protein